VVLIVVVAVGFVVRSPRQWFHLDRAGAAFEPRQSYRQSGHSRQRI